jgi:hypothetical protein
MLDVRMELEARDEPGMIRRRMQQVVLCVAAVVWTQCAAAQEAPCQLYKVRSSTLNISKEPRGDAVYIDMLDNADVVCVTREQKVGERIWGFVDHKLLKPDQRKPVAGWANLALLQSLSAAEVAALRGTPAPPPAAAPPPPAATAQPPATAAQPPAAAAASPEEVVRFTEPLTSGPFPVNGRSLEQLVQGVPLFPPFEGLDEATWKKPCSACHKWDRMSLCEQGATYVKNPRSALRGSHPYGGPEKIAIMQWAKTGCQ